ncbi:MAG: L-rhamnose-proton symporter [Candidatus Ordinivivax streblomastigis]|uniref:L-rhamnose-proton symporter n=1 Tax=Candidatus Ordinivivax streblomastigis TaxID=2540710 RepID=A0A5M8NY32_9BACT|nr:MAG: L-rhamnose-proton symporter [Candidatus Ordinivivax streblomastigis]
MNLFIFYGILLITLGAFISSSFAIPFDKVKKWQWGNYWLMYSLFGYVIVPLIVCLLFAPGFTTVLAQVSLKTLAGIFLMGAVYGVANLTFGLSLRYLGIALGYALSLGLMMALGTLIPPMIDGRLAQLLAGNAGIMLISGIIVSLIGIGISGYAGFLKSKQGGNAGEVNKEFNIWKGVASALFVGVTGSSAALGIEQGFPIAAASVENGVNPLFQDSAVFLVLYSGSFLTTLIWCLYLVIKNKTMKHFVRSDGHSLWKNYLACALAGLLWFITFVFFGMGKSKMGEFSFVAWGILMSMTIVFATVWGLYRKEWKGVSTKIYLLMWTGLIILIAASFLIGLSAN